MDLIKNFLE